MNFYRAREIAIHATAYSICIGASIYGGVKAPTLFPNKQLSLERIVEQHSSELPTKAGKIGVGALAGFIVSVIPTTFVMASLSQKGYIGRRNKNYLPSKTLDSTND